MERTYHIRGRPIRVRQLDDVVAVRAKGLPEARSVSGPPALTQRFSELDRAPFERAGWRFLEKGPHSEPPNLSRELEDEARKVFVGPSGRLMIDGKGVTVKWREQVPQAEARRAIEDLGFSIARQLAITPNLFEVQVPPGQDSIAAAEELANQADCVFAEPSLLQFLGDR